MNIFLHSRKGFAPVVVLVLLVSILVVAVFVVQQITKLGSKASLNIPTGISNNTKLEDVLNNMGRFTPQEAVVATIVQGTNKISVTNKDLNCAVFNEFSDEFVTRKTDYAKMRQIAVDSAVNEAITLLATQQKYTLLTDPRSCLERGRIVRETIKNLTNSQKKLSVSMVSIWYYDVDYPKMGLEPARQKAKTKIDELYQKVGIKQMTMVQAGDAIKGDDSFKQIDANYSGNAFAEFKDVPYSTPPFVYKELNAALSLLKNPGDMSGIIWHKGTKDNPTTTDKDEKFYAFIQLTGVEGAGISYMDWLTEQKRSYTITMSQ